jgi:hypothetical protein
MLVVENVVENADDFVFDRGGGRTSDSILEDWDSQ